jgi:hypothetical protein
LLITLLALCASVGRADAAADAAAADFDETDRELVVGDFVARSGAGDGGDVIDAGFEPAWSDDAACACDAADFARAVASAPALPAIVAAAQRAAGLAHDPVPSWRTRSRWSALVPSLSARIGNSQSWREVTDPTVSRAISYDVRASWRLDRLVYDPSAPRFTAFDIQRRRERRRIAASVTHEYFAWLSARAAQLGAATNPDRNAGTASGTARALIQAQRARAELDALTDGWFSMATRPIRP